MDNFGLVRDRIYSRRKDIHPKFGGNPYSGIAPAPTSKVVLLFTGKEGHEFGYEDSWDDDRQTLTYTGEGQEGNMKFTNGNLAIRDHVQNGHALLVFEKVSRKDGLYKYVGEMQCAGTESAKGKDKHEKIRDLIKFQLVRIGAIEASPDESGPVAATLEDAASGMVQNLDVSDLRKRAYDAASTRVEHKEQARRNLYKRSVTVAAYALRRAGGVCECCDTPAPFARPDGSPYLEVHHIERLSDGGLDAPDHVAALCPTCHRRAHYGTDRQQINNLLRDKIRALEKAL